MGVDGKTLEAAEWQIWLWKEPEQGPWAGSACEVCEVCEEHLEIHSDARRAMAL